MNKHSTISLSGVTKRFKDIDAVCDLSLSINSGEVIGFVGPNGAGKTTTLSMLMGFLRPDKGSVRLMGQTITPETAHASHQKVGFVAGDMVLPVSLTGKQYLNFMAAHSGRAIEQFEQLTHSLKPTLDKPIRELSRGNKQKIALIGALQHEPPVLILDEPTSGLDPLMQDVFLNTVHKEAKKGATVIMSSHILSEVASLCSRIIFMRSGRLILDKPIHEITSQLGKQVTITSPEAPNLVKFLPDFTSLISHEERMIRINVPKEKLTELLRWIAVKKIDDLTVDNRELDDIFHELYRERSKKL